MLDLRRWRWSGERLANPLTILRRLLAWPLMQALRVLLCIVVAAGWGVETAHETWRGTR